VIRSPSMDTRGPALALALAALGVPAPAQSVQVAPFAGYQFGGAFSSDTYQSGFNVESGLSYGGTLDIAISKGWRVELLYSRQETELVPSGPAPRFDLTVERYLVGIQEEKGVDDRTRPFGVFLLGATRFVPGLPGYSSSTRFTVGLALGFKTFPSKSFGFRVEGRGFFTPVEAGASIICLDGACLFGASGNGFWQGEVSAGVVFAF